MARHYVDRWDAIRRPTEPLTECPVCGRAPDEHAHRRVPGQIHIDGIGWGPCELARAPERAREADQ